MEIIEKFSINEPLFDLLWNHLITLLIVLSTSLHYCLIKRRPGTMLYFGPIQSMVIMIAVLENKFIDYEISNSIHIFISIIVLV